MEYLLVICDCCNSEVPTQDAEPIEESTFLDTGEEIQLYWCNECLAYWEESLG